jgi:Methyltransferase domain/C-methyltransferase C-terminal domain
MTMKDNFSEGGNDFISVFEQENVPVFQNKIYPTQEEAMVAQKGKVELVQSLVSGFIFNKSFDPDIMNYDVHYQNEQSSSIIFKNHLQYVLELLKSFGIKDKKIVEVGCGKAVFFEMMLKEGMDCWGFDPTYEGNDERIKKVYFDETQKGIAADVMIMRHTLEHIPNPFSFLHTIAKANDYKGFLFVEVPTFDWIVKKNAFWDIFYEHCNYFTEQSLGTMFSEAKTGNFFGGQYIYLWADLAELRETIPDDINFTKRNSLTFEVKLESYGKMFQQSGSFAVWGAGAKGSTFLNLLDKERKFVQYVIDISKAKQNKFIAGTGHPIYRPEVLKQKPVENILIMNENYIEEIKAEVSKYNISPNILSL